MFLDETLPLLILSSLLLLSIFIIIIINFIIITKSIITIVPTKIQCLMHDILPEDDIKVWKIFLFFKGKNL